ncbi:MAG: hypothetical protein LBH04_03240 [Tannerellaceae bacterium]|nr:hypothetical protein [Tannerellaceae bacterium]
MTIYITNASTPRPQPSSHRRPSPCSPALRQSQPLNTTAPPGPRQAPRPTATKHHCLPTAPAARQPTLPLFVSVFS